MTDTFDITDGCNRYEPCPECRAIFLMGLSTRQNRLAVECMECGYRGPEIESPTVETWVSWPVPSHERDRLAFEGWNAIKRQGDTNVQ